MKALLLAVSVVATPVTAADQFDLVCKGQQRISPSRRWNLYEVRYRIDLSKMIYCRYECSGTETIAAADASQITFQEAKDDNATPYVLHYVDRNDGKWKYFIGDDSDTEGKCEPAAFSGFPTPKF